MTFPDKLIECLRAPGARDDLTLIRVPDGFNCPSTGQFFPDVDGIPSLLPPVEGGITTQIKAFYEENPFPDYEGLEEFGELVNRGYESAFTRRLLESIGCNKTILEVGCGTGQKTHFLSLNNNHVLGIDISTASLRLATEYGRKNGIERAAFAQMNIWDMAIRDHSFDVVISSGVLHHTTDARRAFSIIARKVKPGGIVVVGLYNRFGRLPTGLRAKLIPFLGPKLDWVVRNRIRNSRKANTWIQDQYFNPHETWHSIDDVLAWFGENGIEFRNCYPPILGTDGELGGPLFEKVDRGNYWQRLITQISWIGTIAKEGALFEMIGKKAAPAGDALFRKNEPINDTPKLVQSNSGDVPNSNQSGFSGWTAYVLANIGFASVLFLVINIAAFFYLREYRQTQSSKWSISCEFCGHVIHPTSAKGKQLLIERFGEKAGSVFYEAFRDAPYFAPHPTLHYIVNPVRSSAYTVGKEGIRYYDGWTDEDVQRVLSSDRKFGLMFGGSTTFGHGMPNNETLPYFVNEITKVANLPILNAGAQAYDQIRELDKLIYLLRSGYRPGLVIFLDGINDFTTLAYSNYRVQDKLIFHGFAAGRGDTRLGVKATQLLSWNDHLVMFLNSLPLYRLYVDYVRAPFKVSNVVPVKDAFVDPMNISEAENLFFGWEQFGRQNQELMKRQLKEMYKNNSDTMARLSAAYGFKYVIFYQPIGPLDLNNPFYTSGYASSAGYKYFSEMEKTVRDLIEAKEIPMIDISQELKSLAEKGRAYIDYAHYSPEANQVLARAIAAHLGKTKSSLGGH